MSWEAMEGTIVWPILPWSYRMDLTVLLLNLFVIVSIVIDVMLRSTHCPKRLLSFGDEK
jgi:hypothetical protein